MGAIVARLACYFVALACGTLRACQRVRSFTVFACGTHLAVPVGSTGAIRQHVPIGKTRGTFGAACLDAVSHTALAGNVLIARTSSTLDCRRSRR